jgi:hypothetical protein
VKLLRAIALTIIFVQLILPCVWAAQDAELLARYDQALELASSKNFELAYEYTIKVVSKDPLFYEASVLRIALATLLKKTGAETPQNLLRVAKGRFPIRVNIEQDVQARIDSFTSVSVPVAAKPKERMTVSPYVRKKLALVIGVGSFKDPKISQLRFTANDARTFADTLRNECRFDDVKTLIDNQAVTEDVKDAIDKLAAEATPEDLVVIYIASHGSPGESDKAGVSYIVTYDTKVDKLYATAFKMEDLLSDIKKRFSSERVIVFIDTCYSGATFKEPPKEWPTGGRGLRVVSSGLSKSMLEDQIRRTDKGTGVGPATPGERRKQQGVGRVIIASSSENEQSWESEQIQHGYFTYYLIEALKRQNTISIQGLFDFVRDEVPRAVERDKKAKQNPVMIKSLSEPVEIYLRDDVRTQTPPKRQP